MSYRTNMKLSPNVDNVVHKALQVKRDDAVVIEASPCAVELSRDIALECRRSGADTYTTLFDEELWFESVRTLPLAWLKQSSILEESVIESCTAMIYLCAFSDPAKFRTIPSERDNANHIGGQKTHAKMRERKVCTVGLMLDHATPQRAKAYGIDLERWRRTLEDSSSVNLAAVARVGREMAGILTGGNEVSVETPNGTTLRFSVSGRTMNINDGIIDDEDVQSGALSTSLPTGEVYVTIHEDSGEGTLRSDLPINYKGRLVEGLQLSFREGRVTSFTGEKHFHMVKADYDAGTGDRDRIAELTIGLNPKAAYGYTLDTMVSGAITISIGDNASDGGKNTSSYHLDMPLSNANLFVDGRPIVQKGKLWLNEHHWLKKISAAPEHRVMHRESVKTRLHEERGLLILYIFRHGEAEIKAESPSRTDASRRMTQEGKEQIRRVCTLAKQLQAEPNAFLSSPFTRARETAEISREILNPKAELKIEESLSPEGEPQEVYAALAKFKRTDSIVLVTHIPILGKLIFDLLGGHINLEMNNGALARIDSKSLPRAGSGILVWLLPSI